MHPHTWSDMWRYILVLLVLLVCGLYVFLSTVGHLLGRVWFPLAILCGVPLIGFVWYFQSLWQSLWTWCTSAAKDSWTMVTGLPVRMWRTLRGLCDEWIQHPFSSLWNVCLSVLGMVLDMLGMFSTAGCSLTSDMCKKMGSCKCKRRTSSKRHTPSSTLENTVQPSTTPASNNAPPASMWGSAFSTAKKWLSSALNWWRGAPASRKETPAESTETPKVKPTPMYKTPVSTDADRTDDTPTSYLPPSTNHAEPPVTRAADIRASAATAAKMASEAARVADAAAESVGLAELDAQVVWDASRTQRETAAHMANGAARTAQSAASTAAVATLTAGYIHAGMSTVLAHEAKGVAYHAAGRALDACSAAQKAADRAYRTMLTLNGFTFVQRAASQATIYIAPSDDAGTDEMAKAVRFEELRKQCVDLRGEEHTLALVQKAVLRGALQEAARMMEHALYAHKHKTSSATTNMNKMEQYAKKYDQTSDMVQSVQHWAQEAHTRPPMDESIVALQDKFLKGETNHREIGAELLSHLSTQEVQAFNMETALGDAGFIEFARQKVMESVRETEGL